MKKTIALVLSAILVATLSVGCGAKPATAESQSNAASSNVASSSSPATAEKKTLKIINNGGIQTPEEQQFMREEIIPIFEEEFNCKVEMDVVSAADGIKTVETQMSSGNVVIDGVCAHSGEMPRYIRNGWVAPITDTYTGFTDRTFVESFESSTNDGEDVYFAPYSSDVYLTLINKKALQYLPTGVDVNSLSYEDYAQFAINIAKGEGMPKTAMPSLPGKALIYEVGAMGLSYGAAFPDVNSEAMVKVWDMIANMTKNDAFIPTQHTAGDAIAFMQREEAWLTVGHMGPVGIVYQAAPEQYIVATAPKGDKGVGSIGGAWGMGVLKGAKEPELMKSFIEFMTRPEIMYELSVGLGGTIPPVKEVIELLEENPADTIMQKGLEVLNNGIIHGVPGAQFTAFPGVKTEYEKIFESIIKNKSYTKAELDAGQAAIEALRIK